MHLQFLQGIIGFDDDDEEEEEDDGEEGTTHPPTRLSGPAPLSRPPERVLLPALQRRRRKARKSRRKARRTSECEVIA